jgi:hypothetical protein
VNLPGHICAVVVTTLVLEGWSCKLDPRHSVLTQASPRTVVTVSVLLWAPAGMVRCGRQVVIKWSTGGQQVVNRWSTSGQQVVNRWSTGGQQVVNKWSTDEQVANRWSASGLQVICSCGQHILSMFLGLTHVVKAACVNAATRGQLWSTQTVDPRASPTVVNAAANVLTNGQPWSTGADNAEAGGGALEGAHRLRSGCLV